MTTTGVEAATVEFRVARAEQGHLPGEAAGSDVGDVVATAGHLERSFDHDDHLVGELALLHQDAAGLEGQFGGRPSDGIQLVVGQVGEQGHLAQVVTVSMLRHGLLLRSDCSVRVFDEDV